MVIQDTGLEIIRRKEFDPFAVHLPFVILIQPVGWFHADVRSQYK